jgi:uncharacterized Ntn-hydrolase superfamily protein
MDMPRANLPSGTFSILAISPDSNFMGVAVASGSKSVGNRVPHAKPGTGVIVTQAYANITYGVNGLQLLAQGLSPQYALNRLLEKDPERDSRQVAIMNFKKKKAVFTGANVPEFNAEIVGEDYIVIGNMLSRREVVESMAKKFNTSSDALDWKMVKALKAGSESGGDRRGEKSAALIVVSAEKVEVKIEIASHKNPIEELAQKLKRQLTM